MIESIDLPVSRYDTICVCGIDGSEKNVSRGSCSVPRTFRPTVDGFDLAPRFDVEARIVERRGVEQQPAAVDVELLAVRFVAAFVDAELAAADRRLAGVHGRADAADDAALQAERIDAHVVAHVDADFAVHDEAAGALGADARRRSAHRPKRCTAPVSCAGCTRALGIVTSPATSMRLPSIRKRRSGEATTRYSGRSATSRFCAAQVQVAAATRRRCHVEAAVGFELAVAGAAVAAEVAARCSARSATTLELAQREVDAIGIELAVRQLDAAVDLRAAPACRRSFAFAVSRPAA